MRYEMRLTRLFNISLAKTISLAALTALAIAVAIGFLADAPTNATAFNAGASGDDMWHVPIPAQYTAQCSNGIAVPDPANNPGLVADCAALLAAKTTLEGTTGNLNWSADRAISDWNYVHVNIDNNRVSALYSTIHDNFNGTIPAELGNLSNLDTLWIVGSQLTGNIPAELGNLSNLWRLNLGDNQLTGEIPPELGNLARIRELALGGNQLTGEIPPELGNLANLTHMSLDSNQLTGEIPPELGNLANLTYLGISYNQLTGAIPQELGNIPNLEGLHLYDSNEDSNQFTGCIPLSLRAPLGDEQIERLGLPICAATAADRIAALETLSAEQASVITALQAQLAEHASRLTALEGASAVAPTATPTATPSPTPTSVPGASGGSACIERLADSTQVSGRWTTGCLSANSPDDGNAYYARFYTFTLVAAADVTITLTAAKPPYIYLLEGVGRDGDVIQGAGNSSQTSQTINASLQAGSYTIEASTWNPNLTGDFTLTLDTAR